jgi:hypothetical protein
MRVVPPYVFRSFFTKELKQNVTKIEL